MTTFSISTSVFFPRVLMKSSREISYKIYDIISRVKITFSSPQNFIGDQISGKFIHVFALKFHPLVLSHYHRENILMML